MTTQNAQTKAPTGAPTVAPGSHGLGRFARKSLSRTALRMYIRGLSSWTPLENPVDGYTVIIGCAHRLASMLWANLEFLCRLDLTGCDKILCVVDCTLAERPAGFEERAREIAGERPLEFVYYSQAQVDRARRVDWGWVYSWLSWTLGISRTRTRYAMLHDFDALLLRPGLLRERADAIKARGVEYLGIDWYSGLGVIESDRLVRTFEMMFDAAFVRERFKAIDLFNRMGRRGERRVEFDTFLHAETRAGTRDVLPMEESELVHPSQMICQYVDHRAGRFVPGNNNLFMIPYYNFIGGSPEELRALVSIIEKGETVVPLWGRGVDLSKMKPIHALWMVHMSERLERALGREGDAMDEHVRRYFHGLKRIVDQHGVRP
ncbi:MAG: hypothetical protein AB7Q00_06215 [Phycisphaerales bacterium]